MINDCPGIQNLNQSIRVLIVDDDLVVRKYLLRVFRMTGAETAEASNHREAIKAFEPARFDFVLIDVELGSENGIDLAIRFRDLDPALHIVVMSGNPIYEEKVREAGLGAMLAKPFTLDELKRRIF